MSFPLRADAQDLQFGDTIRTLNAPASAPEVLAMVVGLTRHGTTVLVLQSTNGYWWWPAGGIRTLDSEDLGRFEVVS